MIMKLAIFLSLGLVSNAFSNADLSKITCKILERDIKNSLEVQSKSYVNHQKEIINEIKPELDLNELNSLKTNWDALKYVEPNLTNKELYQWYQLRAGNENLTPQKRRKLIELRKK